jgi:phospholipid-binding lipoprotein MlaA
MSFLKIFNKNNILSAFLAWGLSACATVPPESDPEALAEYHRINDPLEPLNRATHSFNMAIDAVILKPIAQVYRFILPQPIRQMITNFLDNLQSPLILANDLLQGEFERGGTTIARFVTNTTVGVGGLFDPASEWGMEKHKEDFGETLAVWGVGEGFYLVLPFFGPSNPRDLTGLVAEFFADPVDLYLDHEDERELRIARTSLEVIDFRERNLDTLEELERNTDDLYAAMRSAYRQNRAFRISNGRTTPSQAEEDLFEEEME